MAKNLLGAWSFLIGVVIAIVAGGLMRELNALLVYLLVVLGLVVGFLNISEKETKPFLLAGLVLVIVSWLGSSVMSIVPVLVRMLNALLILIVPATIIVALRSVFAMAKS